MSGRARREGAFTLIEMLLAITIFAMLMIGVYQSFDQAFRSYKTVQRTRDLFDTGRGVMDLIHRDLSSAVIFPGAPNAAFIGRDDSDGREADLDSLVLYTLTHTPLAPGQPASDQCEVEYRIVTDRDTGQRALIRREEPDPDDDHEAGGGVTLLTDRIVSLDFLYWDGERWEEYWNASQRGDALAAEQGQDRRSTVNRGVLPEAVETELVLEDEEGRLETFRMATRIMLGGSYPVEPEPGVADAGDEGGDDAEPDDGGDPNDEESNDDVDGGADRDETDGGGIFQ